MPCKFLKFLSYTFASAGGERTPPQCATFDNDRGRLASGWVHRGAKDVSSESLTATSRELKGGMGIIESVDGIPGPQSGDVTGKMTSIMLADEGRGMMRVSAVEWVGSEDKEIL